MIEELKSLQRVIDKRNELDEINELIKHPTGTDCPKCGEELIWGDAEVNKGEPPVEGTHYTRISECHSCYLFVIDDYDINYNHINRDVEEMDEDKIEDIKEGYE